MRITTIRAWEPVALYMAVSSLIVTAEIVAIAYHFISKLW